MYTVNIIIKDFYDCFFKKYYSANCHYKVTRKEAMCSIFCEDCKPEYMKKTCGNG